MNQYKHLEDLKDHLKTKRKKTVAVPCANDTHTLEANLMAHRDGLIDYIFIGDRDKILENTQSLGYSVDEDRIIECHGEEENGKMAVKLIREGKADLIQKGLMQTSAFLRPVVNKETGIGKGGIMSNVVVLDLPKYHKLLGVTDCGMMMYPDLTGKKEILANAIDMFHQLGISEPKVSALCAIEELNPKMPETLDARDLKAMAEEGEFGSCILEGPISMDIAVSKDAAEIKGYESSVAGDSDILLVPSIYAGNILVKALVQFADARMAGTVLGAKCPIAINSRSASAEEKYYSLILCSLLAQE